MRFHSACSVLALSLTTPVAAQRVDYDALGQAMGEPVTTSATGKPQLQSDTPASMVIITHDEIAHSPARDVPGVLKTYAGIDVTRWTAGQSDVAVRGGVQSYNPRLLVLVNGRQVYLDHYGMTDWNLLGIQLEEIQQIELVRGPAGALFGFNAASGVVNIITIDPLDRQQATLAVEGGNHGYNRVAGTLSMPLGKSIGLRVSAGHKREDERDVPANQFQPIRANDVLRDDVSAAIDANLGDRTRATLTGGYAVNRQLELLVAQAPGENRFRTETAGFRLDHDTPWGSLSTNAYSNWLHVENGIGADQPSAAGKVVVPNFTLDTRTLVANASALVRLNDTDTGRVGVEYRDNVLDSAVAFASRIGYSVYSLDGMLDLHPSDVISLTLAARADHLVLRQSGAILTPINTPGTFDRALTTGSFNAAVQWRIGDKGSIRLNGGRATQSPSLVVFGVALPVPVANLPLPVVIAGNPAIRPVVVSSGEVGYAYDFSSALNVEASAFYTHTRHAIAFPGNSLPFELLFTPSPIAIVRIKNIGKFDTYGVELSASGAMSSRLSWHANYSFIRTKEDFPGDPSEVANAFLPAEATPRSKANIAANYALGRWSLSAAGRYTSATKQMALLSTTKLSLFDVRAAFALDARITFRLRKGLAISAGGENLTNASGAAVSPIPADRRLYVRLTAFL